MKNTTPNYAQYHKLISNKKKNSAVAGVYNKNTDEYFYGINAKDGDIPDLVPQLKEYFDNMPLDVLESYNSHETSSV